MKFCGILQLAALLALSEGLARPDEAVHDWSEEIAEGERASAAADYTQAAHAFERALQTAQKKGTVGELGVALASNDLANTYATLGRYREAEPLYRKAIAIWRKTLGGIHPHVATALNNLAVLCGRTGRFREAERLYDEALSVHQRMSAGSQTLVATDMNNLALLYAQERKYSAAEKMFRRAIDLGSSSQPPHDHLPEFLNNLGSMYLVLGRLGEAAALFERALEMQESGGMPPDDPRIALTLRYMGDVEMQRHNYDRARDLYLRALREFEEHFGPCQTHTATALFGIALGYQRQHKYPEAEQFYSRLMQTEKCGIIRPVNSALYFSEYAAFLKSTGRKEEALEAQKRAQQLDEQAAQESNIGSTIDVKELQSR